MNGTHTIIEKLSRKLLQRWVPKWYEAFSDHELGGFYERLGRGFKPALTGQRRLITQCRQLAIYSHASVQGLGRDLPELPERFDFLVERYYVAETGGWRFSIDDEGIPLDESYDLYALAFVIFALAHYYAVSGDKKAAEFSRQTLGFIDKNFRIEGVNGLTERVDKDLSPMDKMRRHESHMHLLEACLFAADIFDEPCYMKMADEMVDLFLNHFYETKSNVLSEYFSNDLKPVAENGHIIVEPGHYCEWIWLLKKHAAARGDAARYDDLCVKLLEWANIKGWDDEYGGIYDELNPAGEVITDTKRLWPFAEALKANALMLDSGVDKLVVKERISQMVDIFSRNYMEERGFWTEWLKRDLSCDADYMPGTTPYHVYFGIMETREVMQARGKTVSITARPQMALYGLRRRLSDRIRAVRLGLKAR